MRKIMFNDRFGLTQAVLEGIKTQTRRIIPLTYQDEEYLDYAFDFDLRESVIIDYYARYKIGEIVAVAQSYHDAGIQFVPIQDKVLRGKSSNSKWGNAAKLPGWNNKLLTRADLMPHQIKIANIRIERLQDISDEDCLSEGVAYYLESIAKKGYKKYESKASPVFWIAGGEEDSRYDQSISYCKECAYEIAQRLNATNDCYRIEGDSADQQETSPLYCEHCGKPLLFSYCPISIDDELEYIDIEDYQELYLLHQVLSECDEDMKSKVMRLLARKAFASLIDKVSGEGTWESNPYVFVYDFKLIK